MMEKFRFRKKDSVNETGDGMQKHPPPHQPQQHYHPNHQQQLQLQEQHQHHYAQEQKRLKQHTNWNGLMQDLFGMDSPNTAESTHESTSSGVASDVTSLYPATPTLTTFKGGDSAGSASSNKSTGSQDSGTKSASLSSSPRPDQNGQKVFLRGTRMSPAPPLPAVPTEAPPLPAKNVPRLTNPSPQSDYHRMNAYSQSPTMVIRGKRSPRDKRSRLPDPTGGHHANGVNNRSHVPIGTVDNSGLSIHDPRAVDPSFYSEINQCYVEAMREEHIIEPLGDDRYIESHFQETYVQNDRLHFVPSPMSPVPHGGHYYNRHPPINNHDHRLLPETTPAADGSRMRQKHHPLPQPQQQQQQQFHHPHQQQQPPPVPLPRTRQSPLDINHAADHCNHHGNNNTTNNNHLSPPSNRVHERNSPSISQINNLNKPPATNSHNSVNKTPHQNRNNLDQNSETVTPRSQTLKGSHTLLTHAQIHSPQPEVRGGRNEGRIKSAHAQSESQLNHVTSKPRSARGVASGAALVNGINSLSLSQNDIHASRSPVGIPSSKRHASRCSPFESLPNDVLLKIFSHLPTDHLCKCAQVCRHWYNAVWDHPILWTSIVINNSHIDIDRALKYLTRRLSYNTPKVCMILEKININWCGNLTDKGLQTAVKRCPELRCLDMQGCQLITNVGVSEAVSRCVNLERLDVTGCPQVTCISLMDSVISQSASRHLQRIYLRYLDMTDCPHVTDQDLSTITSQCTQLLFFYLRRCPLITDLGVTYIANNCNSLRELSLSDCKSITDLGMRELAKLRDNLRYLSVAKCEKVSDQGVVHIARNCNKLRYLNVRGCEAVSDTGLEFLARSCPRLRSLDIGKCDITDEGLYALSMYCPNLRKLGVKSCDAITDKGIVLVAYRCPSLQQLHVQDCCLSPDAYAMVRKYCKRAIIEHTNPGVL